MFTDTNMIFHPYLQWSTCTQLDRVSAAHMEMEKGS